MGEHTAEDRGVGSSILPSPILKMNFRKVNVQRVPHYVVHLEGVRYDLMDIMEKWDAGERPKDLPVTIEFLLLAAQQRCCYEKSIDAAVEEMGLPKIF